MYQLKKKTLSQKIRNQHNLKFVLVDKPKSNVQCKSNIQFRQNIEYVTHLSCLICTTGYNEQDFQY